MALKDVVIRPQHGFREAGQDVEMPEHLGQAAAAKVAVPWHILLVEDERSVRELLANYLENNGFRVTQARDALQARHLLVRYKFTLVILDIMMPGEDGLSLCRSIRAKADIPTILVSAKAEETDRIVGLEIGADDYVVKPFVPRELLARIKAVIRRSQSVPHAQRPLAPSAMQFGLWTLQTGARQVVREGGLIVPLSTGEFNLLLTFLERPHMVLSRDQLLDLTRGRQATLFDRSIDNLISRLRKKIEPDPKNPVYIKTVWGGGYTLAVDVQARP